MQKLLRRSPPGPLLCTTAAANPPAITTVAFKYLRLGFNNNETVSLHSMPTATALNLHATAAVGSSAIYPVRNSRFCTSTTSCRTSVPSRAWIALKESRTGSGSAWFHTVAENAFSVEAKGLSSSEVGVDNGDESEDEAVPSGSEEKPVRVHRRQRSSLSNSPAAITSSNADLLAIPGVGPRNFKKLVEKGIRGVAELKQIYKDKFSGKASEKMVEFLQSSVGIIHRNHAESITTFVKESVDEEDTKEDKSSDARPPLKKRLTFCVEGNISVGKTTFLQRIANETLELRDLVEIVPEPVDKWQDVGPDHFNILNAFYAEPQRYAYTFQNYVFVTRVMQEKESSGGIKPLRLMERSVFSDRMVFVRAVHEAKWMNEMEISIYDSWFDPVVSSLPGLIPDGFIYLRATPNTCHERMMMRKRAEEGGVSLEYLRDLHEKHESWLFPSESGNQSVVSLSKLPLHMDLTLHPDIRDHVFYLEGAHMHSSIQKVPALVLDCDRNIDFSKDIDAKRQYARQVAEFFEFVKKKQDMSSSNNDGGGSGVAKVGGQVLLPQQGGLWVPPSHGPSFPSSLDFRRAMSYMSG